MSESVKDVVSKGFCVGCGACASLDKNNQGLSLNEFGQYQPNLNNFASENIALASKICPFSDDAPDETAIGNELFENSKNYDPRIGKFESIYVGHAGDNNSFRKEGSSGGLTNWLVSYLLKKKINMKRFL